MASEPKHFLDKYPPGLIFGGNMDGHDIVGYCHNPRHRGYLRSAQLREHDCLQKQCKFLERNESSRFFREQHFKKRRKNILKNVEQLWRLNLISAKVYMTLDSDIKATKTLQELEALLTKPIEVSIVLQDLFRFGKIYEEENE